MGADLELVALVVQQVAQTQHVVTPGNSSHPDTAVVVEHHIQRAVFVVQRALVGGQTLVAQLGQEDQALVVAAP